MFNFSVKDAIIISNATIAISGLIRYVLNFRKNQIYGILIGLLGTLVLILNDKFSSVSGEFMYSGLVVIATICYAININLIKII